MAILQAPPLFEELVHLRAERPMAPADRPTTVASESAPDTAAQRSPDRPWWAETSPSAATTCPIRPAWFPPLEREALEAHLGCRIEWFGNERSECAPLDALQRGIEAGRYALVLLLVRFSSHGAMHALRDVCNAVEVPFVRVESGGGLSAICCSLEDAGVVDAFPFPVGELEAV